MIPCCAFSETTFVGPRENLSIASFVGGGEAYDGQSMCLSSSSLWLLSSCLRGKAVAARSRP